METLSGLSRLLDVSVSQLGRESFRPGFPRVDTPKGARYDVEEVRKWREANVKPRAPARERPTPAKLADGALARADDPFILAMMSGDADALTINRAAMQMASRRVALGAVSGTLGANDLDGL